MFRKLVFGMMSVLLVLSMFTLLSFVQPVRAQGPIYIRADGSIDPSTAPISSVDNVTYTFTGNVSDSIVVERDNIVVDGAGYTVQGTGASGSTGLDLSGRENVTVNNAQIISFSYGILLNSSSGNSVSGNNITNNDYGIVLDYSLDYSVGNDIYHNNFINNTSQVSITEWSPPNVWDDGYPSGGNYWSDYVGVDVKKGPNQDEPGSDSIGDTQYTVDLNNVDQFPLMYPYGSPPPPNYALTITTAVNGTTDPAPGTYLYSQGQSVPVQANPDTGYGLGHWELDGSNVSLNNSYSVLIDNNHTLLAVFVQINYTLWITVSPGGSTDPAPGVYAYSSWSNVQVTAIADTDCVLYYWELDGLNIGATNPTNVTMDADHTLNAVFGLAHPPPAPSFWTVPSAVSFDTNNASVGTLFDVTVWGACLDHTYGWQIKMGWNPSLLQVVKVDGHLSYSLDNVAGTLLAVHGTRVSASMFSLFSVEFKVTAAPGVGQDLTCNIDPGYGIAGDWTYWLDTSLNEEPGLSTAPCAYSFAYVAPPPIHDVAVTKLTSAKTVIDQGFLGNLTATVQNQCDVTETVNVTAYANTTSIASENVTLSSGASANVTLVWNATGFAKGNYTISAYALPVPGENNTDDNNFIDGWVIVSIAGDIAGKNGMPDGKVDMKDIATVAAAFGSKPGDSNWNPNCDLNNDLRVDMKDIAMVAAYFGQHYP